MWIDPLGLFGLAGSLAGGGGFGAGAGAVSATGGVSSAHQASAAAIAASRSKSEARTAVGRCEKEKQDPCSQFPTRKAAQNQALIAAGIPVGIKPIARRGIQGGGGSICIRILAVGASHSSYRIIRVMQTILVRIGMSGKLKWLERMLQLLIMVHGNIIMREK